MCLDLIHFEPGHLGLCLLLCLLACMLVCLLASCNCARASGFADREQQRPANGGGEERQRRCASQTEEGERGLPTSQGGQILVRVC